MRFNTLLPSSPLKRAAHWARHTALFLAAAAPIATFAPTASATPGVASNGRISFAEFYTETNNHSGTGAISEDGRFVTYWSQASNIMAEDTNDRLDIYRYDRVWGITLLISASTTGVAGNGVSRVWRPSTRLMSADGRYVLFESTSSDLVANDTNAQSDVFLRDTNGFGSTQRVSLKSGTTNNQLDGHNMAWGMSSDARYILFTSASRITAADTNDLSDLYLRDRNSATTTLISSNAAGAAIGSGGGQISANGRYVTFKTYASLVAADQNNADDAYWKDLSTGTIKLASATPAGAPIQNWWDAPTISGDGRYVAFMDFLANGVTPQDTNGYPDVWVKDTTTGALFRASTQTGGAQSIDEHCEGLSLSHNGRILAMQCRSSDLVPGDDYGRSDVFTKNLDTNVTTLISRVPNGAWANGGNANPLLTRDGASLVLWSSASNYTSGDNNASADVFFASCR